MPESTTLPLIVAFAISLACTPLVRWLSIRRGLVAHPKRDRWHQRPTAMMGGVAVALSVAISTAIFVPTIFNSSHGRVVLGTSLFLGVVGFVDDVVHLKPYQKLVGQVLGAAVVIFAGLMLEWTGSGAVNMLITFVWLVGITNALNLLDNMDGLAAGVAAVAGTFLAINLVLGGQPLEASMLGVFVAALLGFLVYNSNPASIFMGDCGSMFIGFFLASSALLSVSATGSRSRSFAVVIAVPVLVLFIPILDTTLVTVARKMAGRAASQGGRDHTSHRLVALGMSEKSAVWLLYGLAAVSGVVGVLVSRMKDLSASVAISVVFTLSLAMLGVYLAGVRVYDEHEVSVARERPLIAFMVNLTYKRRVFEVMLDLMLIVLAYYVADSMLQVPLVSAADWTRFLQVSAVLVVCQLSALLAFGSYRGIWRYVSIDDLVAYTKSVLVGGGVSFLLVRFALRFQELPLAAFILNAMVLLIAITSSRIAFRILRRLFPVAESTASKRTIIFGAGDAGELVLRELLNNQSMQLVPVGFVDDDPLKVGRRIHGLPVHGGNGSLLQTCRACSVDELLVSSQQVTPERLREIYAVCAAAGITVRRLKLEFEAVSLAATEFPDGSSRIRVARGKSGQDGAPAGAARPSAIRASSSVRQSRL